MNNIVTYSNMCSVNENSAAILSSIICPNINEQPKLKSISLSIKLEKKLNSENYIDCLQSDIYKLCRQVGIFSIAKKSNAKLEIQKGMKVAFNLNIRKQNMLNFLKNLTYFALKNLRDFEGFFIKSFDKNGNYTFSNFNRLAFSEIEFNENFRIEKFNITFNFISKKRNHTFFFLKLLGFPFK